MNIVYKKVSELIPYVNNARKNDQAVDAVASSIKNYGFKQPIVIDSQGEVIAGHTRLKASKKLGLKEVPCIIADDLSPSQIKAYRIADNRVGELAEWDMELLKLELLDIDDFTGFEELEFDNENTEFEDFADKEKDEIEKEIVLTIKFNTLKEFERFQKIVQPVIQQNFNDIRLSVVGGGI
jgi:site-specific DNA-methyltransferase (adenine-specific)